MKKTIKIYLEECDKKNLIEQARLLGFTGRGAMTRLVEKLSRDGFCILDSNIRKLLKVLTP